MSKDHSIRCKLMCMTRRASSAREGSAAPDQALSRGRGVVVRPQHLLLSGRLFGIQGNLRWSLIVLFMVLKAGLIVAVFMHMAWERLALAYAILVPPVLVLVFVTIMALESDYTHFLSILFFAAST
jgi:cytochrome c oxidase subunit IV